LHRSHAVTAVLSAVAFVEAHVNDIADRQQLAISDVADAANTSTPTNSLPFTARRSAGNAWRSGCARRTSIGGQICL
jgi:hypothetical protein